MYVNLNQIFADNYFAIILVKRYLKTVIPREKETLEVSIKISVKSFSTKNSVRQKSLLQAEPLLFHGF